jgi:hypothetical protein
LHVVPDDEVGIGGDAEGEESASEDGGELHVCGGVVVDEMEELE